MMLNNDLRKFQVANDRPEHITFSRKIAAAGQQFARTHLMGDDIFCYYFKLLQILSRTQMRMPAVVSGCTIPKAYAALQISKPKVREGMERLQQPNEELFPCSCHRQRANDEL